MILYQHQPSTVKFKVAVQGGCLGCLEHQGWIVQQLQEWPHVLLRCLTLQQWRFFSYPPCPGLDCWPHSLPQEQVFHCLFGPFFCGLFFPFLPRKVPVLVTMVKTGFLTNIFVFPFLTGISLCCTKTFEFSVGAFGSLLQGSEEERWVQVHMHYPVSAVTSVSVAPIGALCKGCRGCVARRRQTLPAAVIQHCSIGLWPQARWQIVCVRGNKRCENRRSLCVI